MLQGSTNAERIWNFCVNKGMNAFGAAAVLATMDAESGLNPMNLQDSYERNLGFTDKTYTEAIDSGRYSKEQFANDGAGFQICQWTWHSRKRALYEYAKEGRKSIGDLEVGLGFFYKELCESFPTVLSTLRTASTLRQAVSTMTTNYEAPLNAIEKVEQRLKFAETYYKRFVTNAKEKEVNTMGYITCSKGKATKLGTYFNSAEFDCHGTGCCSSTVINEKLVEYLNKIRAHFGRPITITSGYRCPAHNRNVGGATGSRHSKGDAADIVVQGVAPRIVAQYAESIGVLGIGLYETAKDGYFVHIDARDYKSFWYGQACAARTTFGKYTGTSSSSGSSSTAGDASDTYILSIGNRGNKVKELQQNLIKLGYSCGQYGADGDYGTGTAKAVRDFQADSGLTPDGVAGYQTLNAIKKKLSGSVMDQVRVTVSALNIRSGAGTNYAIVGTIRDKGTYKIAAESTGSGATKWGKLADGRGWIALDYCIKC